MKKFLIGCSVGFNVLFVVVAVLFFSALASGYFIRMFIEPAHERWVSQFEQLPVQPGDTVFLGDSITEGGSWHEWFPQTSVRNRGIGGDVTRGVLARLHQVTSGQPAQVFLLIGTNDLAFGIEESEIVDNVLELLDGVAKLSPGTSVYVQSVLPRGADYRERVESLNAALKSAVQPAAQWVDLYPLFLDADGSIADEYSNDELHLTGRGYLVWRDAIDALVNPTSGAL